MTGKEWKLYQEYARIAEMADEMVCHFLDNNLQSPIIFDEIRLTRNKLLDLYPDLQELDEQSEEQVAAFCAGMLFLIMNGPNMGIKWLALLPPVQDDPDGE